MEASGNRVSDQYKLLYTIVIGIVLYF